MTNFVALLFCLCILSVSNSFEITKSIVMKEEASFGHVLSTPTKQLNRNETTILFDTLQDYVTNYVLQNYLGEHCFTSSVTVLLEPSFKLRELIYSLDAQTPFLQISGMDQQCIVQQSTFSQQYYDSDCFIREPIRMGREFELNISTSNSLSFSTTLVHSFVYPNLFYISKWISHNSLHFTISNTPLEFSIISFNIQNYAEKWKERLEIIRQQVIVENTPFLALQEVRWDEMQPSSNRYSENSFLQISDLVHSFYSTNFSSFGYQSAMSYQKQYYWNHDAIPRSEEGLAWFSQFIVLKYEYLHLGRNLSNWNSHQRIVQRIDVLIPNSNKVITVLNTHFPLEDEIRVLNFEDVEFYSEEIQKEYQTNEQYNLLATILVGDLNQENVTMPSSWVDAWQLFTSREPLRTDKEGLTFSTDGKYRKRIDYCFVKSSVAIHVPYFKVIRHPFHTLAASDHYAISITIRWDK